MFSTLRLFKQIPCPVASDCSFDVCLFSHDAQLGDTINAEHSHKKQKLEVPRETQASPGHGYLSHSESDSLSTKTSKKTLATPSPPLVKKSTSRTNGSDVSSPQTASKSKLVPRIVSGNETTRSLPVKVAIQTTIKNTTATNGRTTSTPKTSKVEPLQPRKMPTPPAEHPIRFKLLLLLHEQLARLNKLVITSTEPFKEALTLTEQELITTAVNEEHNTAIDNPKVYTNVMKNRIGALRKTDLKAWVAERNVQVQKDLEQQRSSKKRKSLAINERVSTTLTQDQEIELVRQLAATDANLTAYGYVTAVPTDAEIDKARAGIATAKGWEMCDRCGCRFRAHPNRQEDGALTTGGTCRHHWGRLGLQPRGSGAKPIYSCCQLEQGQPGCEEKPSHVFKVSNAQRLATIIQFEPTPSLEAERDAPPISFDCEMAYTSYGMELIRLTAAAWPSGDRVLDVLVRPVGEVLDLNTRFSGVSIQQWTEAEPWNSPELPHIPAADESKRVKKDAEMDVFSLKPLSSALPIVASPQHARNLLFKLISPSTPLIGHALENDLIAVRVIHPIIIDTAILYPHKRGLPMRNKLKFLVRDEIQWTIQDSGADGHDSLEDALAAGELVRHKVKAKWEVLKRAGWSFDGSKLLNPEAQT